MGFRTGAHAKVWDVKPKSDHITDLRISTSFKNKKTDQWEEDFSGFVTVFGTAAASSAAKLRKGDKIKLGDCDVTTKYVPERKTTYTNYKLFSFDIDFGSTTMPEPGSGEVEPPDEDNTGGSRLPF